MRLIFVGWGGGVWPCVSLFFVCGVFYFFFVVLFLWVGDYFAAICIVVLKVQLS